MMDSKTTNSHPCVPGLSLPGVKDFSSELAPPDGWQGVREEAQKKAKKKKEDVFRVTWLDIRHLVVVICWQNVNMMRTKKFNLKEKQLNESSSPSLHPSSSSPSTLAADFSPPHASSTSSLSLKEKKVKDLMTGLAWDQNSLSDLRTCWPLCTCQGHEWFFTCFLVICGEMFKNKLQVGLSVQGKSRIQIYLITLTELCSSGLSNQKHVNKEI